MHWIIPTAFRLKWQKHIDLQNFWRTSRTQNNSFDATTRTSSSTARNTRDSRPSHGRLSSKPTCQRRSQQDECVEACSILEVDASSKWRTSTNPSNSHPDVRNPPSPRPSATFLTRRPESSVPRHSAAQIYDFQMNRRDLMLIFSDWTDNLKNQL